MTDGGSKSFDRALAPQVTQHSGNTGSYTPRAAPQ
jgi:hypothetical protein